MKKYDVIIPLGQFCSTAIALRDIGIRETAYPFDWLSIKDYKLTGNCGFMGKIHLLCNDFQNAFDLEDLEEYCRDSSKEHRAVGNKRTGLAYVHDFEWSSSVADQYPAWREKYERRVKRLYDNINAGESILFILTTRLGHKLSLDEVTEGLNLLNKKFPGKDIDFLLVQDSEDCDLSEMLSFEINEHIFYWLYRDIPTAGESNLPVLKKILTWFLKGHCEYNLATDPIPNYGLSTKEDWGRWSDGGLVYLKIPVWEVQDLCVEFSVIPFISKKHPTQDVEVILNHKKIADWHFAYKKDQPKTILQIPADKIQRASSLVLAFKIKEPVSPQKLHLGEDTRKLGIGFKTIKIAAVK